MNTIPAPQLIGNTDVSKLAEEITQSIIPIIAELIRRSVDGTTTPLFVDYANSRIIVGATVISASPAIFEVNGDAKVIGAGKGLILPTRNGNSFGRVILENPDANGNIGLSVDPL